MFLNALLFWQLAAVKPPAKPLQMIPPLQKLLQMKPVQGTRACSIPLWEQRTEPPGARLSIRRIPAPVKQFDHMATERPTPVCENWNRR